MSDNEFEKLDKQATKAKSNINEYLRKLISKKDVVVIDGLDSITKELNRVGVNLNQIARGVNSGIPAEKEELELIYKEFRDIWLLLKEFRRKVQ